MGKNNKERTAQWHEALMRDHYGHEALEMIWQHNFDRLVQAGIIVREKAPRGGGGGPGVKK